MIYIQVFRNNVRDRSITKIKLRKASRTKAKIKNLKSQIYNALSEEMAEAPVRIERTGASFLQLPLWQQDGIILKTL